MAGSMFSNIVVSFFVNTQQAIGALQDLGTKADNITGKLLGGIAAVAGIKGLKGYYDQLIKIIETSEKWNIPVEDLYKFTNLFSQFGGTAEEAVATVEQLQKLSNALSFHSNGAFKELSALIGQNLQAKNFAGAIAAIRKEFNRLAADPNGRNAQAELLDMIGTQYPALLRMLRANNKEYEEALKRAEKMRTLTKEHAEDLKTADIKLAVIKQKWQGISEVILRLFEPVVDALYWITNKIEKLPDVVIQALGIIGAVLGAFIAKWSLKVAGSAIGKLLGLGGTTAATTAGTTAGTATTAGATAAGVGAGATAALVGTAALGVGTVAGIGYLAYEDYQREQRAKNRTADEKAYLNNIISQIMNQPEDEQEPMMSKVPIEQTFNPADWAGKMSPTTNNDNRQVTINIYGVNGAEDMMSRLRGLPANNMSPITWK